LTRPSLRLCIVAQPCAVDSTAYLFPPDLIRFEHELRTNRPAAAAFCASIAAAPCPKLKVSDNIVSSLPRRASRSSVQRQRGTVHRPNREQAEQFLDMRPARFNVVQAVAIADSTAIRTRIPTVISRSWSSIPPAAVQEGANNDWDPRGLHRGRRQ
jgi:hypothetical protein